MINPYACRRRDCHGYVVAETVVADALVAPRGRQHINGDCRIGYSRCAERNAVHCPHNGKHQQRTCAYIAGETQKEEEKTECEHLAPVERIDEKSAERTYKKRSHDIARQHKADSILVGLKLGIKINGEKRSKKIESEEKQEIAEHHLDILSVPQLFGWFIVQLYMFKTNKLQDMISICTQSRFSQLNSPVIRNRASSARASATG